MSAVLYRKYRSQRFSDLVGQDAIVKTLLNALKQDRVAHAYLFSGPRGTGKTTTARLLAKAVNCEKPLKSGEPCNRCANCQSVVSGTSVDVIEIDAASHTGVDDVRDLIEKVEFSPVQLKRKVYIIDEVHMLSKSAFNALLKTLEEPPEHVLFILATTELHKIPVTILSRCQRFDFHLGTKENVISALEHIVDAEGIRIDAAALGLVASVGSGSYRDAISTLERILGNQEVVGDKKITESEVQSVLGIPDSAAVKEFLQALVENNASLALEILDSVVLKGSDIRHFSFQILDYLRSLLVNSIKSKRNSLECSLSRLFGMIKVFSSADRQISGSSIPQLPLEMAVFELTREHCEDVVPPKKSKEISVAKNSRTNMKPEKVGSINKPNLGEDVDISLEIIKSGWATIIEKVKPYNGHLFAFLAGARIDEVNNGTLKITVSYDFHKERIEDKKSKEIISTVCSEVFGAPLEVACSIGKVTRKDRAIEGLDDALADDVMDVFNEDVV